MTEQEFGDLVDARFPYEDGARCRELMAIAAAISFNASLLVLAEIVLPPHPTTLEADKFYDLLKTWRSSVHDPSADEFVEYAAQVHRDGIEQACDALARTLMQAVANRPGLYAALSVIATGGSPEVEKECAVIAARWSAALH